VDECTLEENVILSKKNMLLLKKKMSYS